MKEPVRFAPQVCPICGHEFDSASSAYEDAQPGPGDVTLCLYCQGILVFTNSMGHRVMTNAEFLALDGEHRRRITRAP